MGDRLEAGKYPFLGARGEPEVAAAIELFLKRFSGAGHLRASFPARAKLRELSDYPDLLAEELRRTGEKLFASRLVARESPRGTLWPWLDSAWLGLWVSFFVISFLVGSLWTGAAMLAAVFG
jgi:hypothetical protein